MSTAFAGKASKASRRLVLLLKGGLGNQLFQLGAAMSLAKSTKASLAVACPAYWMDRKRKPDSLQIFPEIQRVQPWQEFPLSLLVLDKVANRKFLDQFIATDRNIQAFDSSSPRWISGYFQEEKYTQAVALRLTQHLGRLQSTVPRPCIVVHIRKTDFMSHPELEREYEELMRSYYPAALLKALDFCGSAAEVHIVSDDPSGAENDLRIATRSSQSIRFGRASQSDIWHDLATLASAKVLICSNSTFCWWAARINPNRVMLPRLWLDREHSKLGSTTSLTLPHADLV